MSTIGRNVLAAVAGVALGSVVNMAIITVGPIVIPVPEGVDMSDMDQFAENLKQLPPSNFLAPWLAHALGTLVGAFLAAKIAATHKMKFALGIAALFLIGGVAMVVMFSGPVWFIAADLIAAYLPMGYLGGMLAGANQRQES